MDVYTALRKRQRVASAIKVALSQKWFYLTRRMSQAAASRQAMMGVA